MNNGYGEAPQEEPSIQLGELFTILFRHKWIVVVTTIVVCLGTFAWIGTRQPIYQAQATLLLEEDEAAGGVLSELASLTSDPTADAEIALLKSRSLATVTAASPQGYEVTNELFSATLPDFDPFTTAGTTEASFKSGDPSAMENLGLGNQVDRYDLVPFASMSARLKGRPIAEHRLHARIEALPGEHPERPPVLDVEFNAEGTRVTIAPAGGILALGDLEGMENDYVPGAEVHAYGWSLRLAATGAFAGQRYRVQRLSDEKAVSNLMARTNAVESGRKTNVVLVQVSDSDPYRAAETANAICKNYIRRSVRIGQQKATQTVRFIDGQLEEQLRGLREAEAKVVELQMANPATIALSTTATTMIEQASALELQITQTDLTRRVIAEALGHLETGDFDALARLGNEMPNLLALGFIKELGVLETEALRLDRTDIAGYKALLYTERQRVKALMEASSLRADELAAALADLSEGNAGAMARAAATGPEFQGYMTELASIEGELSLARGTAKDANPIVRSLETARLELQKNLTAQVASSLDGARAATKNYRDLYESYSSTIEGWPSGERSTIDAAVETLRAKVRTTLESQVAGISDALVGLREEQAAVEARLGQLPSAELALAEPVRQRETRSRIVEFLLTSQQEATITAAATSAAAVLIDPAVPPRARTFPKASMLLMLGTLVGFLAGCCLALIHNQLRGALFTEAEVERVSGLPVMGSVPNYLIGRTRLKEAKKGKRFLPMRDAPEGPQAEAYRQIRASLRLAMTGEDRLRTLAVTSSVPGEGKTVTNADLAMVFAASGKRVLLVDCDLRKPQVHNIFNLERGPGIGEVLEGKADWRDCINADQANGLNVITAGRCEARPGELLASSQAGLIVDELREAFDLVVFDLPPAVVVADVANFASRLDAVLMLYRFGGVPGKLLGSAAQRLRRSGLDPIGVIMNAVVVSRAPGGYGYGYGYGYSYEYGERK